MASRSDMTPAVKIAPKTGARPLGLATEQPPVRPAPATGGVHTFVPEHHKSPTTGGVHSLTPDHHSVRPGHEMDYHGAAGQPLVSSGPALGRLKRDTGGQFLSSDEHTLSKQIEETHFQDPEDYDVRPVLIIVEDILRKARPAASPDATALVATTQPAHVDKLDDKVVEPDTYYHDDRSSHLSDVHEAEIIKVLAYPINKISCEIICKSSGTAESHLSAMELLKALSYYSWDAKAVIALAAFAINYGEFWLVEQLHTKNPLAKDIATLKDLPLTMAHADELRKSFQSVLELLNAALNVTHCIIAFKELPSMYITSNEREVKEAKAQIPTAVYLIIRSLLICAGTLLSLIGSSLEHTTLTSQSWEISLMKHRLEVILEYLRQQLKRCKELVERKRGEDEYRKFKIIMESNHIDNTKVLRAMFRFREHQLPFYNGSDRLKAGIESLQRKYVLFLITDLDIPQEELHILHMIYNQDPQARHAYDVLWLPIINQTNTITQSEYDLFVQLRDQMPWLSVDEPSFIEHVAIRYIKEEWKFTHMPMLIVMDPSVGRPPIDEHERHNALTMMWIWGGEAFPFTHFRARDLWEKSDYREWNITLLADHNIEPRMNSWTRAKRVICLYGGDDNDWIREFTQKARDVAAALRVDLVMLYVGKRYAGDRFKRCSDSIIKDHLSEVLYSATDYEAYVWYFWTRLWSMWNSKRQMGRTVEHDYVMKQIMDIFTYDSSNKGWAVFARGAPGTTDVNQITKASADRLIHVLDRYRDWAPLLSDQPNERFVPVLDEQFQGVKLPHHCYQLILPGFAADVPEKVVCIECGRPMEKYALYKCCDD